MYTIEDSYFFPPEAYSPLAKKFYFIAWNPVRSYIVLMYGECGDAKNMFLDRIVNKFYGNR